MAKQARGCPRCGSHNTWGMGRTGLQRCDQCDYRWAPCGDQYCMGYRISLDGVEPTIRGCPDCDKANGGVPSAVARWWPSAWRAVARKLDEQGDRLHYNAEAAVTRET